MKLDFIVIGAQKSGTTSLWQHLRKHPDIHMPVSKELPFFTQRSPRPEDLEAGMRELSAEAPSGALLGKATPDYMIGQPGVPVEMVAERIAVALPEAKLIALLRDPVERAISSYTMAVRRDEETRSLDAALAQLLDPDELAGARLRPTPTNSYLVAGEYGRILGSYRERFPADRMLVAFTEDLARDPGEVLDAVCGFLGVSTGFRPDGLEVRHFQGGRRKLLDPEAEERLFAFYADEILPHMRGSPSMNRRAFMFFYETWNVVPEDRPPELSAEVRARLEAHFRADSSKLAELGLSAPWVAGWPS